MRVTELDFTQIKKNLQAFLENQTEFADYNFDGAALTLLLEILSYNTHYNALLVHLQSNEMFIDTAIKRQSVVSIAKTLGYLPRSSVCSEATVNIVVTPSGSPPSQLVLETTTKFTALINGVAYTFQPKDTYLATLTDGVFTFPNVELIEGTSLSNAFTITTDTTKGPLEIPVNSTDINTISVSVRNSVSDNTTRIFTLSTTVIDVGPDSLVFWIEEGIDGNYQLVFGDNIIGKSLDVGNVVTVSYVASGGSPANGAQTFSINGTVGGEANVAITTVNRSAAGAERESIDSIRFNAPKFYATRDRVVTAQDYKSIVLANLPHVKSVVVWGGEENDPPIYGKVFISADPLDGYVIGANDKNFLINTILRPRSVMSIQHEFVDPEYIYLGFNVRVTYDPKLTNFSSNEVATLVTGEINTYFAQNLSTLDKTFYFSQFTDALTRFNSFIKGILVNMWIQNRITTSDALDTTHTLKFLAALEPQSVRSTLFVSSINGVAYDVYIQDFADDDTPNPTGTGTLKLLRAGTTTVLLDALGTVDYGTGVLQFSDLNIASYLGNITDVRITATPQNLSRNIAPTVVSTTPTSDGAVVPLPARNIIVALDDSVVESDISLSAGVTVVATPILGS